MDIAQTQNGRVNHPAVGVDWRLAAILLLALIVRTGFVLYYPHTPAPDEGVWRNAAIDLSSGKGFTNPLRHPGYISFLAAIYKVSGGTGDTAVRLAQAVLGAAQVWLLFILTGALFKRRSIALLSALFLALYPYSIFHAAYLLCEAFYSFLLTLLMTLLYLLQAEKRGPLCAAMAGAVLAMALLTKSTVLVVAPFILLWFIANKLSYRALSAFLLATCLCVLPWSAHNYRIFGKFVLVTLSGSYLFQANNPETMRIELETRQLKDVEWNTAEYNQIAKLSPAAADLEYTARAKDFMRRNPETVLRLMKMRFIHFWRLYPITHSTAQRLAALFSSGIIIPLALIGMVLSISEWRKTFLIWGMIFAFNFAHMVFFFSLRYRIPLDPFFMVFAAYAMVTLFERFAPELRKRPAI